MRCILVPVGSLDKGFKSSVGHHHVCRVRLFFWKSRILDRGINHGEGDMERFAEGTGGVGDSLWIGRSSGHGRKIHVGNSTRSHSDV